jgi:cytoplasmic iron level regulating protein YaaA (DUF328/UPF0246 family)
MLIIISSAKSLNEKDPSTGATTQVAAEVEFTKRSNDTQQAKTKTLLSILKNYTEEELARLMKLSPKLAKQNLERFKNYESTAKQAIMLYDGDVYRNMKISNWSPDDFSYADLHLRIVSGLYGLVSPLQFIKPYRLEMSCKIEKIAEKGLANYWSDSITDQVNQILSKDEKRILLNLASEEYSAVINKKQLVGTMINIHFLEERNSKIVNIPINSKKARGRMVDFIIRNKINNPDDLRHFNDNEYIFAPQKSNLENMVFIK